MIHCSITCFPFLPLISEVWNFQTSLKCFTVLQIMWNAVSSNIKQRCKHAGCSMRKCSTWWEKHWDTTATSTKYLHLKYSLIILCNAALKVVLVDLCKLVDLHYAFVKTCNADYLRNISCKCLYEGIYYLLTNVKCSWCHYYHLVVL